MAILVPLALFVILMGSITYFGYRRYARPARVFEQLTPPAVSSAWITPGIDQRTAEEPGLLVRVIEQIGEKVPVDPDTARATRLDLIAAGYRADNAVAIFMGARVIACVGFILLGIVFRTTITDNSILQIVIPIGAGFLGFYGPSFYLDHLIRARQERIRYGLPDALDLMVVSVEAGLALDQAIQYVAREIAVPHPDLSEELQLVNLEIRAGTRRVDALRHLARRTNEGEVRKLVAILIQTDRFGTSIAESLRTHSDFMRTRRRQEAEERAGKVGVKLVFPIFFFILPAIIAVAAGPGLLQVFKYLFPMMQSAQQP